jgi:hypothetical protein
MNSPPTSPTTGIAIASTNDAAAITMVSRDDEAPSG